MTRDFAFNLLQQHVKNQNMIRHSLASEAVLRALAVRLGQDPDAWSLAGLLHDLDVEITAAKSEIHGRESVRLLTEAGLDPALVEAIGRHNECSSPTPRSTRLDHALAAGETVTGLITATALVYPDKKVASVKVKSVTKRMKEKSFAASVRRETILECEKLGLTLDEFVDLSLGAMRGIAPELGL